MGGEPWINIVGGSLLAGLGIFFCVFRQELSRIAIERRLRYGLPSGMRQAPRAIALGGIVLAIMGVAFLVNGITRSVS